MKVLIPPALRDYTDGKSAVQSTGNNLTALFADLERHYPGIRFRMVDEQGAIRGHIRVFVNGAPVRAMHTPVHAKDEVMIVQALSGG